MPLSLEERVKMLEADMYSVALRLRELEEGSGKPTLEEQFQSLRSSEKGQKHDEDEG